MKQTYLLSIALGVAMIGATAASAHASVITISDCYTGNPGCASLTGSVTVTITDISESPNNDVKLVIANGTNGFISDFALFYTGGLPSDTVIETFSSTGGNTVGAPPITSGDCNTDNSGQGLNTCLRFPTSNSGNHRFNAGDTVTLFLDSPTTNLSTITFGGGGYAHIQEIGGSADGQSAKLEVGASIDPRSVVPEPASMLLLGTGLSGVVAAVRRRRKQTI